MKGGSYEGRSDRPKKSNFIIILFKILKIDPDDKRFEKETMRELKI